MPVSAERVSARASTFGSSASRARGIAATVDARRVGSISAGVQRTEYDAFDSLELPLPRLRWRSSGTIAPRAVSSTAQIATRPNQRTLGAMSSPASPAPAATSHPSTSPTGIPNASAFPETPGTGTGACGVQPADGAPAAASIAVTSSAFASGVPGPAAHATTRPGSHETCNWTVPGTRISSSSPESSWSSPPGPTVRRFHAAASRRCSDSRSATTWARSSPCSVRALARCSSASRSRRDNAVRHASLSASSTASCSGVASPSASAPTYMSSCHGASAVGAAAGADGGFTGSPRRHQSGSCISAAAGTPAVAVCVLEEERAAVSLGDSAGIAMARGDPNPRLRVRREAAVPITSVDDGGPGAPPSRPSRPPPLPARPPSAPAERMCDRSRAATTVLSIPPNRYGATEPAFRGALSPTTDG